ncbi:flavin reductase [Micromonospora sp. NPDC005197]|uniref:flavin reductase n=1 Tax=unclassified Micromonospora TaxID=2617518 RepID=UPI0033A8C564
MSDLQRHAPVRPFWFCAADAQPWPCGRARADLAGEYADEPRLLAVDMADCLGEATRDLCGLYPEPPNPVEMYARFLGWVRHLAINRFRNAGRFPL